MFCELKKNQQEMRESIEIEKQNTIGGKASGVLSLMCKINFSCWMRAR
jgi:hypothetical protein